MFCMTDLTQLYIFNIPTYKQIYDYEVIPTVCSNFVTVKTFKIYCVASG